MDVFQPVGIGSDFLGYRIEELIGRGGMGVVYRAYDLRLKRPVALKLVAPPLATDERFRERFARESELVMSLEHPNVVPIHDAGDVDGRVYLAMRLVDGSDLGALLRAEGALDPARAMAICAQVAAALDAAHARGLVHRDVKPSNVLLDASEHVYLADFGLTRRFDDEGGSVAEDRAVGTPAYLAPEQLEGRPVDGRTDTYALGCVLYECLTGGPVFSRSTRLAVAWAHLEDEPPPPSRQRAELPESIDAVLDRALAKEREERYPTCGALIAAAQEALGLATPRMSRRPRTLPLAAAASLAIAAAAGVIATNLADGAPKKATPTLLATRNTVARINPVTRKVTAVVHRVGLGPAVAAGNGRRVWVYSKGSGTVSEIDTRTTRVVERESTSALLPAECCDVYSGPVLTADASGAWLITGGLVGKPVLVHVPVGGLGKREYPLDLTPTGVAVGAGAIWVVGRTSRDDEVLRVDPADGRVEARTRFPVSARIDSIAFGYGAAWVVSSAEATLYRVDPRSTRIRKVVVGHSRAARPEIIAGDVWVRVNGGNGTTRWFDPSSLKQIHLETDGPPNTEENLWAFHALWWYDWRTGDVYRQNGAGATIHPIPVTHAPVEGGSCLTSITTAGGAVWVTVGDLLPGYDFGCRS